MSRRTFLRIFLLFLTSCGYRWEYDFPEEKKPTIVVPFIKNDDDGILTSEIAISLKTAGLAHVDPCNGDFRLEVSIDKIANEQIGYRRDPQKIRNKIKKNLTSSEGRRTLEVTIKMVRCDTNQLVWGPCHLQADSSYDFVDGDSFQDLTFSSPPIEVLPFSLGQLESVESAQEAATQSLYRMMGKKIVDMISSQW